ncbi:hypothetical protein CR513_17994, partial [Mucuna pruriens]
METKHALGVLGFLPLISVIQNHGALQCVELSSQELWTWFSHLPRVWEPSWIDQECFRSNAKEIGFIK